MCQFVCSVLYILIISLGTCEKSVKFVSNLVYDKQLRFDESVCMFSLNLIIAL